MTNEELQAHLDAIRQAMKAGEVEEYCADIHEWNAPTRGVVLVAIDEKLERPLRIKPEPREIFIVEHTLSPESQSWPRVYSTLQKAFFREPGEKVVKFREVL